MIKSNPILLGHSFKWSNWNFAQSDIEVTLRICRYFIQLYLLLFRKKYYMIVPLNCELSSKRFLTDQFLSRIVELCKLRVIKPFFKKYVYKHFQAQVDTKV